ncbi:arginine utilization protein RocB [Staphylococcus microti]|uniref:Arginine utilization protein RocB n=1 Tax=Staphylococcus microti TaxID=569857 RepID=A0A0D6XT34_9STAP|nr:M20/M25/M40 family metallo-hydrolase [Staphylococcus microti]KIX91772.1 arginine utilization protein RocB [Staphylococcus microti]PNZ84464.1 arginine utilization protein RocB [Staphylococcus microti]SUM58336.1 peptidase family M20/M25/M40 protein [Staphylococcus microti]
MHTLWQTPESRAALLKQLVAHDSVTHSQGEQTFPTMIRDLLMQLPYFQQHPEYITLTPTDDARHAVVALYKAPKATQTITLISHFDTVGIEDYGALQSQAFDMDKLTATFQEDMRYLDDMSKADLRSGDYLFGRGAMDMKPGLMLHMSLIEKAILEQWDVNLVLMTVPDEEVTSKGMHAAVAHVAQLCQQHDLSIALHLNSEPTFQQAHYDTNHYHYTGSIGKIMPSVLVYGRETHVGTPANGLSSNFILSYIQQEIEYHTRFQECFETEETPLPVSLRVADMKQHYDVQTPFRSVALFNMFLFKRNANEIFENFNEAVAQGLEKGLAQYRQRIANTDGTALNMQLMTYDALLKYAIEHYGQATVDKLIAENIATETEPHLQSIAIVDALTQQCRGLGPTVVTFFAPPYYPATNASYHPLTEALSATINETSQKHFGRTSKRIHYFNGISDLSYVALSPNGSGFEAYEQQTPVFNQTYTIPFEAIEKIQAPMLNCGPIGKDAHKVTERIHTKSAFEELPILLTTIIKKHFL